MLERVAFEYAVIRIVPRVERGEYLNAGVILICRRHRFLDARTALDQVRLRALAPYLDEETVTLIGRQLDLICRICSGSPDAGPIGQLTQRERWHWLAAPASTIVQPGPVHSGLCTDPAATLDHLYVDLVQVSAET